MNENEEWLDEMLDAVFNEEIPAAGNPNFEFIRSRAIRNKPAGNWRAITLPLAAAAVLILGLTGFIHLKSRLDLHKNIRIETDLFVEQLIGDSLFDEGLTTSGPWILDIDSET